MDIIPPLLLQVFLIALNAVFASAEIAIISMSEAKTQKLISDGNKRARGLLKLIQNPAKLLATIQVAITLSGFLGSAFAADNFAGKIVAALQSAGIATADNTEMWNSICVILVTLILSYFTLVFGELVPKRFAMRKAQGLALTLSGPLNIISGLFTPVVWFLTISTNLVLRCMGIDPNQTGDDVKEDDILLMADTSDDISDAEKRMIQNVFEFNDIAAKEFATHRTEVEVLWEDDELEVWDAIIRTSFHKNYPVCKDTTDNIIGVLNIKPYFQMEHKTKERVLQECLSKPYMVPETVKADLLFQQMKQSKKCFAIVLDEYGGVNGVVTFDDILEQIVGGFNEDTPEDVDENITRIDDAKWKVMGITPLDEVNAILHTHFPEEEYETFGGLVLGHYGSVPDDETTLTIQIQELSVEVIAIRDHKIAETYVTVQTHNIDKSESDT